MKNSTIVTLLFSFTQFACTSGALAEDPVKTYRERQANSTPESVLEWLKAGNQRFVSGKSNHGGQPKDARERVQVSSSGQRPLAAILSCIDSRTAPEVVFDTSVGDLFTTRVGGNVINDDILGSLEVSVASGVKLVVVLGHTDCGAVKGACRGVEFEHLTHVLEKVKPSIGITNKKLDDAPDLSHAVGERVASNPRYIAEVSHTNAQQSLKQIKSRSSYLRGKIESGEIQIISSLFDVNTGEVTFDPIKLKRNATVHE